MCRIDVTPEEFQAFPERVLALTPEQVRIIRKALVNYSFEARNNAVDLRVKLEKREAESSGGGLFSPEEEAEIMQEEISALKSWEEGEADVDKLIDFLFPSWGQTRLGFPPKGLKS